MSQPHSFWHSPQFEINPGRIMQERNNPFALIKSEIERQEAKYGVQNYNDFEYLSILAEEFGECSRAVCEQLQDNYSLTALRDNLENELVQTAAVCIAWIQCIRRRNTIQNQPYELREM